jgi:uncharacterized protein (TIGR03000 family)
MILAGALVMAVSPPAVRPARGQGAGGYYYETYHYGYNPGYYARRYPVPPVFIVPSKMAPVRMPYVYHVPPVAAAPPAGKRPPPVEVRVHFGEVTPAPAEIDLQAPADAQVWFDGEKTTQTGALRQFVSPPLTPGRPHTYEVRAAWKEGGREVTESRRLSVRAGERSSVSFPDAAARLSAAGAAKAAP